MSCYEMRCHTIICGALVFYWNQTQPEIGQLQSDHTSLQHTKPYQNHLWHQTQPEIGQCEGAPSELLCKVAFRHNLSNPSWLGLWGHRTQPEIGQLQGAPDELLWIEVLTHWLLRLGLCWHLLLSVKTRIWDFHWGMQHTRTSLHLHLQNWDFTAGSSAASRSLSSFSSHATMMLEFLQPDSGCRNSSITSCTTWRVNSWSSIQVWSSPNWTAVVKQPQSEAGDAKLLHQSLF